MNASSFLLLRQPSLFSLALPRSLARELGKQLQEQLSAAGAAVWHAGWLLHCPALGRISWAVVGKLDPSVGMRAPASLRSASQEGEHTGGSDCSVPACS